MALPSDRGRSARGAGAGRFSLGRKTRWQRSQFPVLAPMHACSDCWSTPFTTVSGDGAVANLMDQRHVAGYRFTPKLWQLEKSTSRRSIFTSAGRSQTKTVPASADRGPDGGEELATSQSYRCSQWGATPRPGGRRRQLRGWPGYSEGSGLLASRASRAAGRRMRRTPLATPDSDRTGMPPVGSRLAFLRSISSHGLHIAPGAAQLGRNRLTVANSGSSPGPGTTSWRCSTAVRSSARGTVAPMS